MATVMYPYDDTGTAPTNLVQGETQVLTSRNNDPYRYFIPMFAPFYTHNFEMWGMDALGSERKLDFGTDYNFSLLYIGATRGNGSVVYGAIEIINAEIQGPIRLNYQCLGGKYSADRDYVVQSIAENNYNPRVAAWDQVTSIQELFPPSSHPQDLDTFTSYRDLIDAIDRLDGATDNQTLRDLIWSHILNHEDPHETMKHLGDYALKTYVDQGDLALRDRIDQADRATAEILADIAVFKRTVEDQRIELQLQLTDHDRRIRALVSRVEILENRVTGVNDRVTELDNRLSPKVQQNTDDIHRLRQDLNTATGGQSQVIDDLIIKVNKNTADIAALDVKHLHNESLLDSRIDLLEERVTQTSQVIGIGDDLPEEFQSTLMVLMVPHIRFMIWDAGIPAYVRAPWHLPGILQYSYTNPSNGMTGYLLVRGDIEYQKASYPDLVRVLGLAQDEGTFTLVEMRGEFLRVLDNGRGVDVNRALLSHQGSQNLGHSHTGTTNPSSFSVSLNALGPNNSYGPDGTNVDQGGNHYPNYAVYSLSGALNHSHTLNINVDGGDEARPKNIAVPLWISI